MTFPVQPPFPIFTGTDGQPLQNGKIYIGTANMNPETNPIAVFWDDAGTIPAAQPIRTTNGYISRSGTPAILYVGVDYSMTVRTSTDQFVLTRANVSAVPTNSITTNDLVDGAVTTPKLADDAVTTPKIVNDAVTLAKLSPDVRASLSSATGAGKNRFINPRCDVDQRNNGAAIAVTTTPTFPVDRWAASLLTGTATADQTGSVLDRAVTITATSAVTGLVFRQRIEAANIGDLAGATVTLSFEASSNAITSLPWNASRANAVDNFGSTTSIASGTVTITPTPTRYSVQIALPAEAVNGVEIRIASTLGMVSGNTLRITKFQLESGPTMTPFEWRSFGQELALCQRYYQIAHISHRLSNQIANDPVYAGVGFKTTMRASPTAAVLTNSVTNLNGVTNNTTTERVTVAGNVAATGVVTLDQVIGLSAEL